MAVALWAVLMAGAGIADSGDAGRPSVALAALSDKSGGSAVLDFELSAPVPYRLFTMDGPARLVVDFKGAAARPVRVDAAAAARRVKTVRAGNSPDGAWARFVAELGRPYGISSAELSTQADGGAGRLRIVLRPVGRIAFAEQSRRPPDGAAAKIAASVNPDTRDGRLTVALDPGHGGIDPGAVRDGISEKEIALAFAHDLKVALELSGRYRVVMTRSGDEFVPLRARVLRARSAGADLMISLHLNTVEKGNASGAAVYTLGSAGSDSEAAAFADYENGVDSLAGTVPDATEPDIVRILSGMASAETAVRSKRLSASILEGLRRTVGELQTRPSRRAGLRVLRAPDLPSVLLELGFLSDERDRANLTSRQWRIRAAGGIVSALDAWAAADAEASGLARQ
ncbi:MAG: N-acetylmuramoyl-L-alanine amidase [Paracoccaceae bacterium]